MGECTDPTVSWLVCCNKLDPVGIRNTLLSIFDQEYRQHEIIFVSNGAYAAEIDQLVFQLGDQSQVVIKRFVTGIVGLTFSLNLGLNHCDGDFIARLDVGDIAHPSRLRLQVAEFGKLSNRVIGIGTQYSRAQSGSNWTSDLPVSSDDIAWKLWRTSTLCHPSILLRTKELKAAGGYEGFPYSEDFELWLRLTRLGYYFTNLADCLVDYDAKGGSARGNPQAYAGIAAYFFYELITAPLARSLPGLFTYLAKYSYFRIRCAFFGKCP